MTSEVDHHGRTSRRRVSSRKSMVHPPPPLHPPEENKENMTADVGAMAGAKHASLQPGHLSKKKRSKSIGPGGLASLEEKPGDQRKVREASCEKLKLAVLCVVNMKGACADSCIESSCTAHKIHLEAHDSAITAQRDPNFPTGQGTDWGTRQSRACYWHI